MKRTGHRGVRNKTQENKGLDRYLSRLDVWAMAFGCMVGWGAFVMPGTTFLPAAGPAGTVIALAAGTLIMLVVGVHFSFFDAAQPQHRRRIFLYQKRLRPGSRLPGLLVFVPFLPDHRVPERHGASAPPARPRVYTDQSILSSEERQA